MTSEEIRARIVRNARNSATSQIDLAWDILGVVAEDLWRSWTDQHGNRFTTVRHWLVHDVARSAGHLGDLMRGVSYAQRLFPLRTLIDQRAHEGKLSYTRFVAFGRYLERRQATLDDIRRVLEQDGKLLIESFKTPSAEFSLRLNFTKADLALLERRLTAYAITRGYRTVEQALLDLTRQLNDELPEPYQPFRSTIEHGSFRCRVCRKISSPPAVATDTIRSGSVAVCETPCKALFYKIARENAEHTE